MKICFKFLLASVLGLLASNIAYAGKSDDVLRIAFNKELENIDSYYNSSREGVIMQRTIWDGLIYRDPYSGEYTGNLASSWKWLDETRLELELRQGIKFHNGEAFDADDVVYTVNWITDIDNGVKVQRTVNWLKSAEKLDKYKVVLHLKAPFPAAIEYLSGPISMYPNEYYAEVGPVGMAANPVGTGPYKIVSVDPGKSFVLEKYEDYHKNSPKGQPKIGRLDIRTIPDINTSMAELFTDRLDWLWQVPADQAEKLALMDRYTVVSESTMRIGYIEMDTIGKSGKDDNPMADVRVRRAVAHAIDRETLVKALLKGKSLVVNSACFPSQFGCEQDVTTYEYNPEKAKKLLAEAGYADGFEIEFYAYRNRDYAEAIMNYLSDVGIRTDFKWLQYSALRELRTSKGVPMSFLTWGSYSVNDTSAITSHFFKFGSLDFARDEQVRDWLDIADSSVIPAVRKDYYTKALRRIANQAYWVPLFSYNSNYVFSKDVDYTPAVDAVPRFFQMSWK